MRCDARKEIVKEGKKKRKLEVETKTKQGQGSVGERPQAESDERRRCRILWSNWGSDGTALGVTRVGGGRD